MDLAVGVWLLCLCLLWSSAESTRVQGPAEYCQSEIFYATCRRNEVIVMTSAHYGRMRTGKCVTSSLGYLGCSSDVLPILHAACSGRTQCHYPVPSPELDNTKPCFNELKTYLEVTYTCVKVAMAEKSICSSSPFLKLHSSQGYLSSHVARHYTCGSLHSPWRIPVTPGQKLNITVIMYSCEGGGGRGGGEGDYIGNRISSISSRNPGAHTDGISSSHIVNNAQINMNTNSNGHNGRYYESSGKNNSERYVSSKNDANVIGFVSNTALGINKTIYGSCESRQHLLFEHSVDIQIKTHHVVQNVFLLKYEVSGCQDLVAPRFALYRREGDAAVVGCEHGDTSWHLTCVGNSWRGVIGNCLPEAAAVGRKEKSQSFHSVSTIVIIFCIALSIAVAVLVSGFCAITRKQKKPHSQSLLPDNSHKLHTLITYPDHKYGHSVRTELIANYESCSPYSGRSEYAYGLVDGGHVTNRDAALVGEGHMTSRDARLVGEGHVTNRDAGLVGVGHVTNRDAGLVAGGHVSKRDSQYSSHSYVSAQHEMILSHDNNCT